MDNGTMGAENAVLENGKYQLSISLNGCTIKDSINISVINCECIVYFPNAFSPNNNGTNDIYKPITDCNIQKYSISIYNNWGELIYNNNDFNQSWNGRNLKGEKQQQGIYYYIANYKDEKTGRIYYTKGNITLLE